MASFNNIVRAGFAVVAIGAAVFFVNQTDTTPIESQKTDGEVVQTSKTTQQEQKDTKITTENSKQEVKYPAGVVPIAEINQSLKGNKKTVAGTMVNVSSGKGHNFYIIKDLHSGDTLKIVVFNARGENASVDDVLRNSLNNKVSVKVNGKVDYYKGEIEIIAESAEAL